jgi:hypothetical protein
MANRITSVDALINSSLLIKDWRTGLPRLKCSEKVAREIYALIGLLLRQFVRSWHSEIIDDSKFVNELVQEISQVVNLIIDRLQRLNLDDLILDDIPYLIDMHLIDYRQSLQKLQKLGLSSESIQSTYPSLEYHNVDEQLYLTVLSRGMTSIVLSAEELNSPCARAFVTSIMKDIVLQNIMKVSEPWMIYDILLKLLMTLQPAKKVQTIPAKEKTSNYSSSVSSQISEYYHKTITIISSLVASTGRLLGTSASFLATYEKRSEKPTPFVARAIFPLLSHILDLELRNPLLASTIHVAGMPFRRGKLGAISTEFISTTLYNKVHDEQTVIKCLGTIRTVLFPNGYLGPGRPVPSEEEQIETKKCLVMTIKDLLPEQFKYLFVGPDVALQIEEILDIFNEQFANKQLLLKLLDLIMCNLFPELSSHNPEDIRFLKMHDNS